MLIIDTKSIRDTKKNEERRRSRSDRFVNEVEKKRRYFDFRWKKTKFLSFKNRRFWQWIIAEIKKSKFKICQRDTKSNDILVETLNNVAKCSSI